MPAKTATLVSVSCAVPVNPTDNAIVPANGPFDFTWEPFGEAASYVVAIGPSDWYPTNFPVSGTILTRYMETFPASSSYQWSITALNAAGQEICKTETFKFVTSAELYATPSYAYSDPGIVQSAAGDQPDSQDPNPSSEIPHQDFKFGSIAVNDSDCSVGATVSVITTYPVNSAIMRYTFDPSEANSIDFCNWGSAFGLGTTDSSSYGGYNNFSGTGIKNGDVIYLMAKFVYNQGVVGCSPLVQHTITSCSTE